MTTTTQPMTDSTLCIEGLHNARDLGGFPTPTAHTRRRVVVRSEVPTGLTGLGRQQLSEHGIAGYLDLRSEEEAGQEPGPFAAGRHYRRVPLLDQPATRAVRDLSRGEDLMRFMLFERAQMIAAALLNLLDLAAGGGVLVHCRAGKDRTGLIASLLLSNAGVADHDIAADHARSEANLEDQARDDAERELISRLRVAPTRDSMLVTLAELRARHGEVPEYLRHIGLSEDEVAALRLLLVAEPGRRAAWASVW